MRGRGVGSEMANSEGETNHDVLTQWFLLC